MVKVKKMFLDRNDTKIENQDGEANLICQHAFKLELLICIILGLFLFEMDFYVICVLCLLYFYVMWFISFVFHMVNADSELVIFCLDAYDTI